MKRVCALLSLSVLLLSGCSLVPVEEVLPEMPVIAQIESKEIKTVTVMRGDMINQKDYICKYQPVNQESLVFSEKGPVIKNVYVQVGDTVKAGDLIAELDNTQLHEKIAAQQQTVDSLNLQIAQQQKYIAIQEERIALLTQLVQTDAGYESRLNSARQTLNSQNEQLVTLFARYSVEQTCLEELEESLKTRQLYAGMDGTVSFALKVELTTVYAKSQNVCTIQDLTHASFVGTFPAGHFEEGEQTVLYIQDQPRDVIVQSITKLDDEDETVSFALVTPDATLKTGDTAKITLVLDHLKDVLYLPNKVLHRQNDICYVYYQDENGLTAVKEVEEGLYIDGNTQIISGLEEGDQVIYG